MVLAVLFGTAAVLTKLERRRLAITLPAAAAEPAPRLDGDRMVADLRRLASPEFEGRRIGEKGGIAARLFVETAFREAGVLPSGASGLQRFSFEHKSLRALFRRDRPYRKTFTGAANVLAFVPGTAAPGRWIVVSAHYDHLGMRGGELHPGADDNASGVAALLGIARFLAANPLRHSVLFAAFDAEELGLRGARAFVEAPPVALDSVSLVVNMDMISRPDGQGMVVSGTSPNPALRRIVAAAAARSTVPVHLGHDRPLWKAGLVEDWTSASDHGPFAERGIPWLYFGVEDHEDYHRPTDTADRIDEPFFRNAAELVLATLEEADRALDR